jgi:hypothetical protein
MKALFVAGALVLVDYIADLRLSAVGIVIAKLAQKPSTMST